VSVAAILGNATAMPRFECDPNEVRRLAAEGLGGSEIAKRLGIGRIGLPAAWRGRGGVSEPSATVTRFAAEMEAILEQRAASYAGDVYRRAAQAQSALRPGCRQTLRVQRGGKQLLRCQI
jgi:hypothetical protein